MLLFQAPLDTCLDSPFFASLSVHGLHFTVYALSRTPFRTFLSEFSGERPFLAPAEGRCSLSCFQSFFFENPSSDVQVVILGNYTLVNLSAPSHRIRNR